MQPRMMMIVGAALIASGFLTAAIGKYLEGQGQQLAGTVLWYCAIADAIIGAGLLFFGLRKSSESSTEAAPPLPPEIFLGTLRRDLPDLSSILPNDQSLTAVVALLLRGRKIEAIKTIRQSTGYGLKDAKDLADQIERAMRSVRSA